MPDTNAAAPRSSADEASYEQIHEFHANVENVVGQSVAAMHTQVEAFRELLTTLVTRHEALQADVRQASAANRWGTVSQYQDAVTHQILEPLQQYLSVSRPDESILTAAKMCLERLNDAADTFPASVDLPDVTSIYQVAPTDSTADRYRKGWERTTRRARKIGRFAGRVVRLGRKGTTTTSPDTRHVALRSLGHYHVEARIAKTVERLYDLYQQQIARAASIVDDVVGRWLLEQLAIEHQMDSVGNHRPPGAPATLDSHTANGDLESEGSSESSGLEERLVASIDALDGGLKAASAGLEALVEEVADALSDSRTQFDSDVQHAGTALLPPRKRRLPKASHVATVRLDQTAHSWRRWYDRTVGRFDAALQILGLRSGMGHIEDQFLSHTFDATLKPIGTAFRQITATLQEAIEETATACDRHADDASFVALAGALGTVQTRTLERLRVIFRDAPGILSAHEALTDPGSDEWDAMQALIGQLPEAIALHRPRTERDARISLTGPHFVLRLRDIASDAFDPPLPNQLAKPALPLKQRITQVWDGAAKIEDIIRFNLGATLDELAADPGTESGTEDQMPTIDRARQLASEALRRSIDSLDDLSESLTEPWGVLERAVFASFQDDWGDVQRRLRSEGAVEERLVGLTTRTTRTAERYWAAFRGLMGRMVHRARLLATTAVRSARRLIAKGQAAVGAHEIAEDESISTLDAIIDLTKVQASLPLVYRKLFSFEPLTESSLMEGRTRDLVRVRQHFERWTTRHDEGVFIISNRLGNGRTTFLNVLREKVFANADVRFGSIDQRIKDTDALATFLADLLGMEVPDTDALANLQEQLNAQQETDRALVCMLDNVEHLVLQGTGTNDLIEEALMFFSRTDRLVYWVATIGYESWHFITKTTGSATGFVTHHHLGTIDRTTIEDLIFARHRRSGIPVTFAPPTTASPILRQRLRRARTEEKKQEILRKEYFDALHSATDQDIRLALFYWIRSTDFTSREDELVIRPFEALSFRFLNNLDLIRSFTLKAFILHNTLTLQEHQSIFRLPEDESIFVLESLLNERLIESATGKPNELDAGVVPEQPYRIRRLLLNPVLKHLRDKHFVY